MSESFWMCPDCPTQRPYPIAATRCLVCGKALALLPAKPTAKTWEKDARALFDMGASSVSIAVVKGCLDEMNTRYIRILDRLNGRHDMNLRTSEEHPDPRVREEARLRVLAYKVAIDDVCAAWDLTK